MTQDYTTRLRAPQDQNGTKTAAATTGNSSSLTADGNWQAVVMASQCKRISINCDDGSATYDHIAAPNEFHFSFDSTGVGRRATSSIDLSLDAPVGATIGYVRATAGLIFSITVTA